MKDLQAFLDVNCELAKPLGLFIDLHRATHGDPCRTGCAYFKGGQCAAFKVLFPGIAVPAPKVKKRDGVASGYVAPSKKPFRW